MNGRPASLITPAELGVLLRPHDPINRQTIWRWTRDGRFGDAVNYHGRVAWYSVPKLVAAGWLLAPAEVTDG